MREERKVVTALFADLVGSTALGERLDPEERQARSSATPSRGSSTRSRRFGGTVKDLAGDGVLALFGAPVAHEDDAERAVRAGLRIARGDRATTAGRSSAAGASRASASASASTPARSSSGSIGAGSRVEYAALRRRREHRRPAPVGGRARAPCWSATATHRLVEPLFEWGEPARARR